MRRVTRRSWLGLSAVVLGDAAVSPLQAEGAVGRGSAGGAVGAAAARTGGEPYLRDGGPSDNRVRVTRDLLLMQGHFLVFDQLVEARDWSAAKRRIDDATFELRERVEPYMKGQGVRPFTPIIDDMLRALDRRDVKAIVANRKLLAAKSTDVDKAFAKFRVPYRHFALRGAIEALKVAVKAYQAAVVDGTTILVDEYQDGRGAIAAVEAVLARIAPELLKIDAGAAARVIGAASSIKTAWPTITPPPQPLLSPETLATYVEVMENAAEPFWAKSP